jgi:Ca-activated chloride channel family protein
VKPLKSREGETTVVLVSDGKETCEGDPCALVKELKASGIKFTMHVVGFDVTPEETKQLECIAKAGGGEYFAAKNAGEFKKAAEEVVEKANPIGELRVTAIRDGKPVPGHIEVYKEGSEERLVYNDTVQIKTDAGTVLDPGTYDVKVIDSGTAGKPSAMLKGVVIERGAVVEKSADFTGGKAVIGVTSNGKKITGWLYVLDSVTGKRVASSDTSVDNPYTINLQPGTYDIKVKYPDLPGDPVQEFKGVVIGPGKDFTKDVEFSEGYVEITSVTNGEKDYTRYGNKAFASYRISDPVTGKRIAGGDTSAYNPDRTIVAPGTYKIVVKSERVRGEPTVTFENVVVEKGATVSKIAEFERGHLEVGITKDGEKVTGSVYIYKAGTEKRVGSGDTSADNPDRYTLIPGKYDIVVKYKKGEEPEEKKFEGVAVDAAAVKNVAAAF